MMTKTHHCAHSLLPPVKSCTHDLRPKRHTYDLPRCNSEVCKSHLYPVTSFGICNLYGICVFIFYILLPLSYLNCTCTFVTCLLNINQSINQSSASAVCTDLEITLVGVEDVGGGLVKSTHRIDDDRINGRLYVELFGVVVDHNALLRSVLRTTTGISIILIVEPKCTLAACCPLLSHGEAAHGKDVTLHFMQDAAMTHNGRYTVYTSEMSNRSSVRETSSALFHPDCLRGLLPAPFLLSLPVFVFSFSLFFVSVPCARLSWPYRQLLSARNFIYRIVSYRIVSYRMT